MGKSSGIIEIDKIAIESIQKFYEWLQGGENPKGIEFASKPKLTPEQAFSVIYTFPYGYWKKFYERDTNSWRKNMAKSYCPCKTCTDFHCDDCVACDICMARTGCKDDISDEETEESVDFRTMDPWQFASKYYG